jgi:hypothetical protein
MAKVFTAEYDAEHNTLRLAEPLDGVRDHEKVQVQVIPNVAEKAEAADDAEPSQPGWIKLRGSLSKEAADDFARVLNELFPPWD